MNSLITDYIPQRPPMVMVDKIISAVDGITITSFEIKHDNIFVENGLIKEPGIIENIAQTAAAGVGYICKLNNTKVPLGYIGAIKNLSINFLPKIGSVIETTVKVEYQVMNATIVKGTVHEDGKIVAEGEMKIFLQEN